MHGAVTQKHDSNETYIIMYWQIFNPYEELVSITDLERCKNAIDFFLLLIILT